MENFDPKGFVEKQIEEIRRLIGKEKAVIAISGGVDSSTCAVLTHMAIGENLICIMLDDAFMREGEPEQVAEILSRPPLSLPVRIERVQERFLKAVEGLKDAEEKRKAFRRTFYETLGEIAKKEGSKYLVQGTILADIIETVGGIKTQHNVLEQMGIRTDELYGFKVVEPLATLLKWQVREVARYLKIPSEISERQPFPGPGLLVRVVGQVKREKLASLKKATSITEKEMAKHKPDQYFSVIMDNVDEVEFGGIGEIKRLASKFVGLHQDLLEVRILANKATGLKEKERRYGNIVKLKCINRKGRLLRPKIRDLIDLQKAIIEKNDSVTRVLYTVAEKEGHLPYIVAIRAVVTRDFLKADVAEIPWSTLETIAHSILMECENVSEVCYDVTPKPPATIEME
ncbi:MAG: ATP-binding protein [Nitrososphaerota archaeon]|nr:GMP synthase [Candidatus Bathyarchaeota archaeon]MDW8049022.1 ATP-binding protein [Nitrososphaerota archaeon]